MARGEAVCAGHRLPGTVGMMGAERGLAMMQWVAEHLWAAWLILATPLAVAEMLTPRLHAADACRRCCGRRHGRPRLRGCCGSRSWLPSSWPSPCSPCWCLTLLRKIRAAGLPVQRRQDGRQPRRRTDGDHGQRRRGEGGRRGGRPTHWRAASTQVRRSRSTASTGPSPSSRPRHLALP